ncbi:hypothetical protein Mal52_37640 [Symmachiella dynata]|uniref:Uncharacterized protein n=2 Tax=Symmachiella dynata TaxID=2527995 RepID=A0A517ZS03_9PLAN|nr:hypothetical protein Mal52_37640 [Symmachiella dynata]
MMHQELDADFLAALHKKVQKSDPESTHLEDNTLALAIEWIRMRDLVAEGRIGKKANTFLGFVAGRVGVRPPDWWSKGVRRGVISDDGRVGFISRHFRNLWKGDKTGWQFSGVDNVVQSPDGLEVEQGAKKITLKKSDFCGLQTGEKWDAEEDGAVAAVIRDDICVVGFQCGTEYPGTPYLIYCLKMKTGKLVWKQVLRRGLIPSLGGSGGPFWNYIQITVDGERVSVWSGNGATMAVEVFHKKDGKQIAMFSSYYLNGIQLAKPAKGKGAK